ncbi:MAG: DUF1697 domain-containing protein [Deltaproteobacteria bacterium]|nr:DUF1697 domain-containing protein [Deltaproteobacteria bacterium]
MARTHAAFLRGVMPTNCKMPELAKAFEAAGFTDVLTVLGSGNVVFSTRVKDLDAITKKADAAMTKALGRTFTPYVRTLDHLESLVKRDPYARFHVPAEAKRDVTFLPRSAARPTIPAAIPSAAILAIEGDEAFSFHVPRHPDGPRFMKMFLDTFGEGCTTRTWETVQKVLAKR